MYQMAIKYTNIFHSEAFQKIPKLGFWYGNIHMYHLATLLVTMYNLKPKTLNLL
jgi:hypothetical protein